jgi:hypothetical protein
MQTRIPSSLKWLADRRARLVSQIRLFEKEALMAERRTADLKQANNHLRLDLAAIDRAFTLHKIIVNPEVIAPLERMHQSARFLKWGALSRHIFSFLGKSKGGWRSTTEVLVYIASREGIEINDDIYNAFRLSVRKRLGTLRYEGKLIRRHQAKGNHEGYWALPPDKDKSSFIKISRCRNLP